MTKTHGHGAISAVGSGPGRGPVTDPLDETGRGASAVGPGPDGGHFVVADGLRIYFKDEGRADAPVLLMLHGGLVTQAAWDMVAPLLLDRYRIVRPDTRAHGRSRDDGGPLSYSLFADDASNFLRVLGIDRALVVGHSDGGATGISMALRCPQQLAGLVAIGTPYDLSNYLPGVLDELTTWMPTEADRQRWQPHMAADAFADLSRRLVGDMWSREPNYTLEQLSAIVTPSIVLHSEHEEYFTAEASRTMAATLTNATYLEIPACAHEALDENPEYVAAQIRALAAKVFD